MAVQQLLNQSAETVLPYITVGTDHRGSVCWKVIGADVAVRCYCGHRAVEILQMICKSKGISLP
jgi:hypothetical protein